MKDSELKSIINSELRQAVNYHNDEQATDRTKVWKYYMGEPFGDEVENRSQIVSTDVADTIEWVMPELMKIFASKDYVEFKGRDPSDVQGAEQATKYINFVIENDNDGFVTLHNFIKDGLMFKLGVVKVFWEEHDHVEYEEYQGLTAQQLVPFTEDANVEIEGQETHQTIVEGVTLELYDLEIKRTTKAGVLRIETVPPEEFLYSRKAKSLRDCRLTGHRTHESVSDLVERGYPRQLLEDNVGDHETDNYAEKEQRFSKTEAGDRDTPADDGQKFVLVNELYMKVDYDGDGISEFRRIVTIGQGNEIVENEPWDDHPFAVLSPILMPHTMVGRSLAELVMDIQRIKSSIIRQLLDNMYFLNNQRTEAVVGKVNLDDLLSNRPGGVVRVKEKNSVNPLVTPQIGAPGLQMLDYVDQVRDARTGFNKFSAGIDPDSMQDVKVGTVDRSMMQMMAKIQLMARIIAETGMKQLFRVMLRYTKKFQQTERMVRVNKEFIPVDPSTWRNDFDQEVNVGLGSGQPEQKFQALLQISMKQEQILMQLGADNPLCTPAQYAHTLGQMVELVGFRDPSQFFNTGAQVTKELQEASQEEPPPDPDMVKAQADIELDQKKAEADLQLDAQSSQSKLELERQKMQAEIALKRQQMEAEFELKQEEMELEYQLKLRAQELEVSNENTNVPRDN